MRNRLSLNVTDLFWTGYLSPALAVAQGGGLGAIPCAMLTAEQLREQLGKFRAATSKLIALTMIAGNGHTARHTENATLKIKPPRQPIHFASGFPSRPVNGTSSGNCTGSSSSGTGTMPSRSQ